ncbi:hypothetical protein L198_07313 [Cryptococcus wingfieldii CBS 7118]|uniref:Uncharacterized protein n=1 Tax=Cryptococcus wingfieldii CBS 7118 TaxID=1295528 RepID=A0A1E3IEE1_9TREE|nr:hypothetical protein L198_07313 [Cryptococcus wingfieldii CBS 7118]ODN86296.1 hypothetical protein L198_07313 [Cryptococcus wingfieldii CBS 7118]
MPRNRQTSTQNSAASSSRRPQISAPILQSENSFSSRFGPLASVRDTGSSASTSAPTAEEQSSPSQEASTRSAPARRDNRRHGMQLPSSASASASRNQQPFRGNAEDSDQSTEFEEDFSSSCDSCSEDDDDARRRESGSIVIGVETSMSRLGIRGNSGSQNGDDSGSECAGSCSSSGEECSESDSEEE